MSVPLSSADKILLVRLSALGDVIQCLPALAGLRAARPDARIGWLVEGPSAALLKDHPHLDAVFVYERLRGNPAASFGAAYEARRTVTGWGPDVAVDLQGNLKSAVLTRFCGAPVRIGLPKGEAREGAHLLSTHRVGPGETGEHRADRAGRLMEPLGVSRLGEPRLPPTPESVQVATDEALATLVPGGGPFAVLTPGTSDFGAFKRWPPARFAGLARRLLQQRGLPSLVSHGPGQRALADRVVTEAGGAAVPAPDTGDLRALQGLLERATVVVGADSGPVLMASTLGVPTVALFGPKDPGIYGPRGPSTAVVVKGVYCSPCRLRRCGDPICMSELTEDEAWNGVERVLG